MVKIMGYQGVPYLWIVQPELWRYHEDTMEIPYNPGKAHLPLCLIYAIILSQ